MNPLSEPECDMGYPVDQLEREMSTGAFVALQKWMYGQTMGLCTGQKYSHETKEYYETGHVCGPVYYKWDVDRFLAGHPVID